MTAVEDNPYASEARYHDLYPEMGTDEISTEPYYSEEYFQLEKEYIFKKCWFNAGRIEDIPKAGDYVVKDVPVCDTSIVIVRRKDGGLNAFHNVCSHRGNKMAYEESGNARSFNCRFHGWTYDHDGELLVVPDEENYFNLEIGRASCRERV